MANEIFKFTINRAGRYDVENWFNHFKAVGRPAGIVRRHNGDLAVWRQGRQIIHRVDPRCPTSGVPDAPVGVLIAAVHGFEELWTGEVSDDLKIDGVEPRQIIEEATQDVMV